MRRRPTAESTATLTASSEGVQIGPFRRGERKQAVGPEIRLLGGTRPGILGQVGALALSDTMGG
jgi:hypothetical protein